MIEVCFAADLSELLNFSAEEGASPREVDLRVLRCIHFHRKW